MSGTIVRTFSSKLSSSLLDSMASMDPGHSGSNVQANLNPSPIPVTDPELIKQNLARAEQSPDRAFRNLNASFMLSVQKGCLEAVKACFSRTNDGIAPSKELIDRSKQELSPFKDAYNLSDYYELSFKEAVEASRKLEKMKIYQVLSENIEESKTNSTHKASQS